MSFEQQFNEYILHSDDGRKNLKKKNWEDSTWANMIFLMEIFAATK